VLTVELTRGWNSRLGFSLKADRDGQHSTISAIYDDSVAAKDGRLKIGDTIIMVKYFYALVLYFVKSQFLIRKLNKYTPFLVLIFCNGVCRLTTTA